jgi:hypothetical protein
MSRGNSSARTTAATVWAVPGYEGKLLPLIVAMELVSNLDWINEDDAGVLNSTFEVIDVVAVVVVVVAAVIVAVVEVPGVLRYSSVRVPVASETVVSETGSDGGGGGGAAVVVGKVI